MSDMKCPVCNKGTVTEFETAPYFACSNEFCPSYSETDTTEYDILIRTRKALDVAVKRLGYIKNNYKSWTPDRDAQMIAQAVNGLDEIKTALEQKDNGGNK